MGLSLGSLGRALFVYVPGVAGVALVAPRTVEASTIELELRTLWGTLIARAIYPDLVALLSGERGVGRDRGRKGGASPTCGEEERLDRSGVPWQEARIGKPK